MMRRQAVSRFNAYIYERRNINNLNYNITELNICAKRQNKPLATALFVVSSASASCTLTAVLEILTEVNTVRTLASALWLDKTPVFILLLPRMAMLIGWMVLSIIFNFLYPFSFVGAFFCTWQRTAHMYLCFDFEMGDGNKPLDFCVSNEDIFIEFFATIPHFRPHYIGINLQVFNMGTFFCCGHFLLWCPYAGVSLYTLLWVGLP